MKDSKDIPESRINLPKTGLAEDLLSELERPDKDINGQDQLYKFADSLKKEEESANGSKSTEEALETWVFFTIDKECYGLPVSHVQEILRVTTITKVPHAPRMIRGVTNMRGKVLPVVDLRIRLGLQEAEIQEQSRILVTTSRGRNMGLLVDSVQQVARITRSSIQPAPADVITVQSDYILGVYHAQDMIVIMLDVEKILIIKDKK